VRVKVRKERRGGDKEGYIRRERKVKRERGGERERERESFMDGEREGEGHIMG
jgi:hypothetical protein